MQKDKGHIIGRQKISVRYRGQADGMSLQKKVNELCHDELPLRLEPILDRFSNNDTIIRIDQLKIHATLENTKYLKEDLLRIITEKIELALQQAIRDGLTDTKNVTAKSNFTELLCFYLQHGYLPWWSTINEGTAWQEQLAIHFNDPAAGITLSAAILSVLKQKAARGRLAAILSAEQLIYLLNERQPDVRQQILQLQQDISRLIAHLYQSNSASINTVSRLKLFWKSALMRSVVVEEATAVIYQTVHYFIEQAAAASAIFTETSSLSSLIETLDTPELKQIIQEHITTAIKTAHEAAVNKQDTDEQLTNEQLTDEQTEEIAQDKHFRKDKEATDRPTILQKDESIHTGTAGLVLVASYLSPFFKNLELITDKQINDATRAVTLLHYIGTGKDTFEEFEIVLEKTLCGIPLADPILPTYQITADEKVQTDELLSAIISHWTALKNTSPQGLQLNFLQREGRLTQNNHQWTLTVKREAHDILLDFIPWNFRMIKTPWMTQLMTVNWH